MNTLYSCCGFEAHVWWGNMNYFLKSSISGDICRGNLPWLPAPAPHNLFIKELALTVFL